MLNGETVLCQLINLLSVAGIGVVQMICTYEYAR